VVGHINVDVTLSSSAVSVQKAVRPRYPDF